jgi:hypothetical protein
MPTLDGGMTLLGSVTSSGGTTMVISGIDTTGYQNFMLTVYNRGFSQGSSDMYLYFNNTQSGYGWTNTWVASSVFDYGGSVNQSSLNSNAQIEGPASGAISTTRIIFGRNADSTNYRLYGITDKGQADGGSVRPQGETLFSVQSMSAPITSITIGSTSSRNFTSGARADIWGLK